MDDRAFDGLTSRLRSAQEVAGDGFGFSWPARFPMARIDRILVRGVEPKSAWLLPATGSDHRPVAAAISW
ncbi:vancomycin resistance protein VanJ [Streptomyces qinglanensis]|uniref:Vancomycin resistance protein VanJ n=1 Tax=Streptomyces qinglanensis TaxID=943816 RepID=A0A1H9RAF2_9ACTN|nr:vancomycin resistance protein VanJ [Streptomyces qinglanensis]